MNDKSDESLEKHVRRHWIVLSFFRLSKKLSRRAVRDAGEYVSCRRFQRRDERTQTWRMRTRTLGVLGEGEHSSPNAVPMKGEM